ncbi:Gfo/Idh/MocA family oxidoreductase [Actinosynnema sp. NPDC023587]|uniref:Gfo/Idh/MocA family oxidoreductase n=1 Tax=Actinosynnema sp. NPDC023587 TaxID=3154695 RepID=UPI0033E41503
MKNILLIGVGPHARRNHLPALLDARRDGLVSTVVGVDLLEAEAVVEGHRATGPVGEVVMHYVESFSATEDTLPGEVRALLDRVVREHSVDAVLVATEPSFHVVYSKWALGAGLSVLLDKPLSVHADSSTDPARAARIQTDFDDLARAYDAARREDADVVVSVQCQRRYHPAFLVMRDLVAEVAAYTNCPVTSVQSFHSDGQWRLPDELLDIGYHSFDRGYGKAAHSGYHFFDIVPWLIEAGERPGKALDSVEVHVNSTRPVDLLAQLTHTDYDRLFPGFAEAVRYPEDELRAAVAGFGEVDAFVSLAFKSTGRTVTLGSINLVHNGFSQRGSFLPNSADLYKGNGRVRHETHIVEQGPFQAIHFHSLQSLDDDHGGAGTRGGHDIGEKGHVSLHVFRNDAFNPGWRRYEGLDRDAVERAAGGHGEPSQSASRRRAVHEFLEFLNGKRDRASMASELPTHRRSSALMAGTYLSAARQWAGRPGVVAVDFRRSPREPGEPHGGLGPVPGEGGVRRP